MLSLSEAKKGEYKIVELTHHGRRFRCKLCPLGFNVGGTIEVIQNSKHFPLVIRCKRCTFALGRGMASKIMVERI